VSWSGAEHRWIFEWIFYLSILWAVVSICREGWSNRVIIIGRLRKVEPSHIIILGLFIAACGVVWQMRRSSPDPQIAALQSRTVTAESERDAARAERDAIRQQAASRRDQLDTVQSKPTASYSPEEKDAFRKILLTLSGIINGKGRSISRLADKLLSEIDPLTASSHYPPTPAFLRDQANEIVDMLESMNTEIYRELLPANTYYSTELVAVLGSKTANITDGPPYLLSQKSLAYIGSLNTAILIDETAKNDGVSRLTLGTTKYTHDEFEMAVTGFKKWISECNSRIDERRHAND
jgi:hypothetical protein